MLSSTAGFGGSQSGICIATSASVGETISAAGWMSDIEFLKRFGHIS